jgi:hypothetical protein
LVNGLRRPEPLFAQGEDDELAHGGGDGDLDGLAGLGQGLRLGFMLALHRAATRAGMKRVGERDHVWILLLPFRFVENGLSLPCRVSAGLGVAGGLQRRQAGDQAAVMVQGSS